MLYVSCKMAGIVMSQSPRAIKLLELFREAIFVASNRLGLMKRPDCGNEFGDWLLTRHSHHYGRM